MSIKLTVGKKEVEIKFNYGLVFKLNKALETQKDADNGAGIAYSRLKSGDESALHDIIRVAAGRNTPDEAIFEAVEEQSGILGEGNEGAGLDKFVEQMIDEVENSGFFMRKLRIFKAQAEKTKAALKPEQEEEIAGVNALLETLTNVN